MDESNTEDTATDRENGADRKIDPGDNQNESHSNRNQHRRGNLIGNRREGGERKEVFRRETEDGDQEDQYCNESQAVLKNFSCLAASTHKFPGCCGD
jgi:hypothetical protein